MKSPRILFVPLLALIPALLLACGGGTAPTPPGSSPDFEASLTPVTASVTQGQQASLTVTLKRLNGFADAVNISLPNPPLGLAAAATTIPAGSDSELLTITTNDTVTVGKHSLEFSAVSGGLTHAISLELTVNIASTPDFSVAITPSSVSVKQGSSTALDVTLNRLNGFAGAVTVTLGNPPAGLSAANLVIPAGSSTGKLNLAAGANAATGSGSSTVNGVSGALSHSASLSWTILSAVNPDFALSTTGGLSVVQGDVDGITLNVDRQNGFNEIVSVTLINPPAGIKTVALQIPSGQNSAFLGISVGAQVPVGTINLTISGVGLSSGLTRTLKQVLTVVAAPDTTAPTLVSSSPANNATGVSIGTSVTLNFSEPMNPNLTFVTFSPQGGGTNSAWTNGNTTLKLNLLATVPGQPSNVYAGNTTYTLNVDGEDAAGNTLTGATTFGFTTLTVTDTSAPTVLDTVPAAGAQGVAPGLGKTFTATFSEKMSSSVLTAVNFVPNAGATNCVFTDSGNTTVQCTPTAGLNANQFYIMTITTAAKDVAGNPLAQLNSISFNTGPTPDTTQPKISSITPTEGATSIDPGALIKVLFSEPMNKVATQAAFSFLPAIPSSTQNFSWNPAGTQMIVYQNPSFAYGAAVIWSVGSGAKDLSGNLLESASSALRSFTVTHKGTFKLYSDGTLDGRADNIGNVLPGKIITDHFAPKAGPTWSRGFVSFDLKQISKLSTITKVTSASLHVFQDDVLNNGDQYALLGNVLAENVNYAFLSSVAYNTFFNTPAISAGTTNILSTNAVLEYKVMDVTQQVGFDVQNHNGLFDRSQWRFKFANDATTGSANGTSIIWANGTAPQSKKPYLDITYLYP
jgi:methionine-rich copper-binding protein CopC